MNQLQPTRIYEVERLIDKKIFNGKTLYLVKWKNFPIQEATWQSVKVLENVKDKIKQFKQSKRIGQEDNADFEPSQQEFDVSVVKDDFKKKRGRPKKHGTSRSTQIQHHGKSKISNSMINIGTSSKKRGRGRPKRIKEDQDDVDQAQFNSLNLQNQQPISKIQQKQRKKKEKQGKKSDKIDNSDYQPSQQDYQTIPKLKNDFNRGQKQSNFVGQSQYVSSYREENHELMQAINRTRSKNKKKDITISLDSSQELQQNDVNIQQYFNQPEAKKTQNQKNKFQEVSNRLPKSGTQNSQSKQKENQMRSLKKKSKDPEKSKEKSKQSLNSQVQPEKQVLFKKRQKKVEFGIISKLYIIEPIFQKSTSQEIKRKKQPNRASTCQYLVQFQDHGIQKVASEQLLNKMMNQQNKDSFRNLSTWIRYLESRFKSR